MICLAIAGSVVAGIYYVAVDLPAQKSTILPPANDQSDAPDGSPYTPIFSFFPYSPGYQGGDRDVTG
ncbi:MAG: hypothetical protein Q7T80_11230 [Methanoregula sp.]|nr:hypothetical protein [Methanoregula sp.]